MRVAELYEPRHFRLVERGIEEPGPGHVQVRVKAVGICGSDLHYFSEGAIGDTPCVYPMVMGHEPAGVVVSTGPGVSGWSPGDRAALEPAVYCYHCEFCRSGRHNVCASLRFLSTPSEPGFFRDYVNLPVHNVLPLPPELSFEEGTLFEPLAVVLHSLKLAQIQFGESIAVFGAGPIGLLTVLVAKLSGAGRIWSVEPLPHRRSLALSMGADAAVDPAGVDPVREVLRDTAGRGVDVVFDCAAKADTVNQCIAVSRSAGRVVVTGIPSGSRFPIDFSSMRRKETTLLNVRRSNHESDMALELLREQRTRFTPLLTHELPLEQLERAFELADGYAAGVGKTIVKL
jgi:L-iditol 2-dehydrogenase